MTENCPKGCNLLYEFEGRTFSRAVAQIVHDRVDHWLCPDCGAVWPTTRRRSAKLECWPRNPASSDLIQEERCHNGMWHREHHWSMLGHDHKRDGVFYTCDRWCPGSY